jgi:hypothetical protein
MTITSERDARRGRAADRSSPAERLLDGQRRRALVVSCAAALMGVGAMSGCATSGFDDSPDKERWMDEWMQQRTLVGQLYLSRFVEPVYFLVQPIAWVPNAQQAATYPAVRVPNGFVTDFASIPRLFWSALRPDGEYAYAAIVHDYLYWQQLRPRHVADDVFLLAMQDHGVDATTAKAIHVAVRMFGASAWNGNAELRKQGERRVLARFPDQPTTRWSEWKKRPDVFARDA